MSFSKASSGDACSSVVMETDLFKGKLRSIARAKKVSHFRQTVSKVKVGCGFRFSARVLHSESFFEFVCP